MFEKELMKEVSLCVIFLHLPSLLRNNNKKIPLSPTETEPACLTNSHLTKHEFFILCVCVGAFFLITSRLII